MIFPSPLVVAGFFALWGPPPGVHRHEADLPRPTGAPAEAEGDTETKAPETSTETEVGAEPEPEAPSLEQPPPPPAQSPGDAPQTQRGQDPAGHASDAPKIGSPLGPTVSEAILPAGLRVLVAQDSSLPVAAVTLAVEVGTEDDPPGLPGLIHALAYHLLQGNRELAPLGAARIVHDAGGRSTLAIGAGQVRYESVIPISILEDALWVEAQRLRAPTLDDELWEASLSAARRDRRSQAPAIREAMALAYGGQRGLAHDGFAVSAELEALTPQAVGQHLAESFRYDRSTLVVVSPLEPSAVVAKIRQAFTDLPPTPRANLRTHFAPPTPPQAPLELTGKPEDRILYALPTEGNERASALVLCHALNHLGSGSRPRGVGQIRCETDDDPRRGALWIRVTKVDDSHAALRSWLARLRTSDAAPIIETARQNLLAQRELEVATPLGLARRLAYADPASPVAVTLQGATLRDRRALTGEAALARIPVDPDAAAFEPDAGILLQVRPRSRRSQP